MKPHPALPLLSGATAVLLATACSAPAKDRSDAPPSTSAQHPDQRRHLVEWGKGDAEDGLRRAERALAYDDTPTDLVDTGVASFPDGLEKRFPTPGKRPYRLDITCAAPNTGDVTLTLGRGDDEQEWTVPCNERQADQFNIPPGSTPFTARITPIERQSENLAQIVWRLHSIAPDDVYDCPDDITGCDER